MLYFIPWVILILAVIIAVPVAAKMSPGPARKPAGSDDEEIAEIEGEEIAVLEDDFGAEGVAEPLSDDAFADFK